jgi:hypothetical protein
MTCSVRNSGNGSPPARISKFGQFARYILRVRGQPVVLRCWRLLFCVDARGCDVGVDGFPHASVEAGFDCCGAFGEVVAEGDVAVVDVLQAAVQVRAAAVDVAAAFGAFMRRRPRPWPWRSCVPGAAIGIVAKARLVRHSFTY